MFLILGIQGAYTIEASFCGLGDNNEKQIIREHEDAAKFCGLSLQLQTMLKPKSVIDPMVTERSQDDNISSGQGDRYDFPTDKMVYKSQSDDYCPSSSGANLGDVINGTGTGAEESSQSLNTFRSAPIYNQLHISTPSLVALARKNSIQVNEKVGTRRKSFNFKDTGDTAYDKVIRSYETAVHYTKQDLKNMGRDIVRGIFKFANLEVPLIPTPPPKVRSPGSSPKSNFNLPIKKAQDPIGVIPTYFSL